MKVIVVGSKGQLGTELIRQLQSGESELGKIPAVYQGAEIVGYDMPEIDITRLEDLRSLFDTHRPDVVFNCAAYTNVDGCETHQDDAFRVNAVGARNLAMVAERVGAKLVHVSTDYVFDGIKPTPRCEYDATNPTSVYGQTKLLGEQYVQSFCTRWFIVRTAWLYGYWGKNFVKAILKRAGETGSVTVVDDQRGNPTNAVDLAFHLLKIAQTEEYGIYHCTGNGECSWFEFAREIVACAGIRAQVTPCTSDQYPSPVKRPAYSALEHRMLRLTVGDDMRDWQEALACFMTHREEYET